MKKRKKESPRKLTENTSPRAKKSCKKIFFEKRKKMRGNYCNSRSNVIKLTKIDGFIE